MQNKGKFSNCNDIFPLQAAGSEKLPINSSVHPTISIKGCRKTKTKLQPTYPLQSIKINQIIDCGKKTKNT